MRRVPGSGLRHARRGEITKALDRLDGTCEDGGGADGAAWDAQRGSCDRGVAACGAVRRGCWSDIEMKIAHQYMERMADVYLEPIG